MISNERKYISHNVLRATQKTILKHNGEVGQQIRFDGHEQLNRLLSYWVAV